MTVRKKRTERANPGTEMRSLSEIGAGQWIKISALPQGVLYAQFVRLGLHEGQRVRCLERLPGGTIVLQRNRQQVAVGHQLAKDIYVIPDGE